MVFLRHPSYADLNHFADGELAPARHRRISEHLAGCSRCRREVAFIRQAGELARSLETPALPDGLLGRVLERRAEGDRVLLPLESPGARPARRRRILPSAAAAVVLLVAGLFAATGLLEADHAGLWIEPQRPTAGESVAVRYNAGFEFAGSDFLKLKARFRTENGRVWEQIAAILDRGDDGMFTARFDLPDSVVYVALAVEDLEGEHLDSNNGRLWEVVVFGHDGRPTPAALWERFHDARPSSLAEYESAVQLAELHPESPRGWVLRFLVDPATSGQNADSVHAVYRDRFKRLERELSENRSVDPDELAAMAFYGAQLGETASAEYWLRRAERNGADGAVYFIARNFLLWQDTLRSPTERLRQADALWRTTPFPIPQLAELGWQTAVASGDWGAVTRWLARYRDARGALMLPNIINGLRDRFPAEQLIAWGLDQANASALMRSHRPLHQPDWLYRRRVNETRQRVLANLAEIAREADRPREARIFALEGLPLAWETRALETIGQTLLESGDTSTAVQAFARVAADPVGASPPAFVAADPQWTRQVAGARSELNRYVLRESVIQFPDVEVLQPGRAAVVAFRWDCDEAEEWSSQLSRSTGGARLHVVLLPRADRTGVPSCDLPVPVTVDWTQEIRQTFGVVMMPSYYVLDDDGRVRFTESVLEEVPRQLAALRTETPPRIAD